MLGKINPMRILPIFALGLVLGVPHFGLASEPPSAHQHISDKANDPSTETSAQDCRLFVGGQKGSSQPDLFESLQIETSDIKLYESFFETILHAPMVQHMDHPQMDTLRGYCYRGVLIIVRQDLKTVRPTGWVQINYAVPDVAAVQQELEQAYRTSPVVQRDETERNKIVRFRLKLDVRRGDCRAIRLEVGGPEGFMIGFDQIKKGSCKPSEPSTEAVR